MLKSRIVSGHGSGNELKVNGEGEIGVVVHTHPPVKESLTSLPFRQYFTSDGTDSGSNDMRVDGSSAGVSFYIEAITTHDIYVKSLNVKLADSGAAFDEFGNLSALTNGVAFEWISQEVGTLTIHDGIKDNLEWFRLSKQEPVIIDLSGGGADAVVATIDLAEMFGNPWGVRLSKSSTERLSFKVQDNLSVGVDEFNIIGYGVKVS